MKKNYNACYSIMFHKNPFIAGELANWKCQTDKCNWNGPFSSSQRRLHLRSFLTVFVSKQIII